MSLQNKQNMKDLEVDEFKCGICKQIITLKKYLRKATCEHCFHKSCLAKFMKSSKNCPLCNTQLNFDETQDIESNNSLNEKLQFSQEQTSIIQKLINDTMSAYQIQLMENINQIISKSIETGLKNLDIKDKVNNEENVRSILDFNNTVINADSTHTTQHQDNGLPESPIITPQVHTMVPPEVPVRTDKITQIIHNWKIRFSGNLKGLSIDAFLYRVEALTKQTLQGDFELLCRHISCLFEDKAADFFWRYHRTVNSIIWPELCNALRAQFRDTRTDMDYRELIHDRKQKAGETFDSFYEAILKLTDCLEQPICENTLVEILRRNLVPEIQHEILNLSITTVSQLREICRRREYFLHDVRRRMPQSKHINDFKRISEVQNLEENDIAEIKLKCWNCREDGHRYQECVAPRSVFCYGCGTPNVYKPTCSKCNASKNATTRAPNRARQ